MEHLQDKIEDFLREVMEIKSRGMEHFQLVWRGNFFVDKEKAINYINNKADLLELFPIFTTDEEGFRVAFVPKREVKKSKKWINIVLLLVTIFTTLIAGAALSGVNPISPISNLLKGIPFSITIMLILGGHELGHYFAAKKNNVEATFPYFIPAPHLIGTFGAVIKMKSPIKDKNSLVEIGASGPIVGFILATIALHIGLSLSKMVPFQGEGLILGDSILLHFFTKLYFPIIQEGFEILLHPIAFAGWIGYFVTAINLLPIGQLDGGHISYALFQSKYRFIAYITFASIMVAGLLWLGWIIWGIVIALIVRFKHPPPLDNISEITLKNKIIGYTAFVIFLITFIPNPFQLT
jgi:membrane-associated protease RseP (regulator of RpoE activity)